jgi:hypothetical protein
MRALEISQGLLGRETIIPVRLYGIAKFDQGRLRSQDQPRPIDASLSPQQICDRIGRTCRGAIGRVRRPRGRKSGWGLRGRDVTFGARRLWSGRRGWRRSGR